MDKHTVRSPEDALTYVTDCTLATVTGRDRLDGSLRRGLFEHQGGGRKSPWWESGCMG